MAGSDAVKQGLDLSSIPGRINQHNSGIREHIHTVGWKSNPPVFVPGCVNIKIASEVGDFQFYGISLAKCYA